MISFHITGAVDEAHTVGLVTDVIHARMQLADTFGDTTVDDARLPITWKDLRNDAEVEVHCAFEDARNQKLGDHIAAARAGLLTIAALAVAQLEALDRAVPAAAPRCFRLPVREMSVHEGD